MSAEDRVVVLDTAMADVASLLETLAVLALSPTPAPRTQRAAFVKELPVIRMELALAASAYLSALLSSKAGLVDDARIEHCRAEADSHMSTSIKLHGLLLDAVGTHRMPVQGLQVDLTQLTRLALSLREAEATLSSVDTIDFKSAAPIADSLFVHLRAATLAYLAAAHSGHHTSSDVARFRSAAVAELKKALDHLVSLESLEKESAEPAGPVVTSATPIKTSVGTPLRKLLAAWSDVKG